VKKAFSVIFSATGNDRMSQEKAAQSSLRKNPYLHPLITHPMKPLGDFRAAPGFSNEFDEGF